MELNTQNLLYFYSTVPQVFAALIGLIGMGAIYYLQTQRDNLTRVISVITKINKEHFSELTPHHMSGFKEYKIFVETQKDILTDEAYKRLIYFIQLGEESTHNIQTKTKAFIRTVIVSGLVCLTSLIGLFSTNNYEGPIAFFLFWLSLLLAVGALVLSLYLLILFVDAPMHLGTEP